MMAARTRMVAMRTNDNCMADGTAGFGNGLEKEREYLRMTEVAWLPSFPRRCGLSPVEVSALSSRDYHSPNHKCELAPPRGCLSLYKGASSYINYSFNSLYSDRELWSSLL